MRLLRFLILDEWKLCLVVLCRIFLSRLVSDHFPIMLVGGALMIEGALPFRFKNMWLKAQSFKNLISNWWSNNGVRGIGSFGVM